ncbi:hypothetical protein [uncultured Umboniibacter sp.]|uniref:hypothetical protein n=1 Tax=uncultured Umboniibacter sp. TaxID=1798917 RepID=UPI0026073687|nr:hypothetical protein [uncultured Umboniibacter sp.]
MLGIRAPRFRLPMKDTERMLCVIASFMVAMGLYLVVSRIEFGHHSLFITLMFGFPPVLGLPPIVQAAIIVMVVKGVRVGIPLFVFLSPLIMMWYVATIWVAVSHGQIIVSAMSSLLLWLSFWSIGALRKDSLAGR